ncbi:HNH endonuclease [Polynucleobacter sp.]|uniref:HNH endonuclease n=1 Tax=Polynucleobacter sp. TaxID=2029855 RepID=UPI003F69B114
MNRGRFKPNHIPWNKGLKGFNPPNRILWVKGNLPHTAHPKGTIKSHYKHGEVDSVCINIDWHGNRKPKNIYAWYVWEVANQRDRPKGFVMYHIDQDKTNNDLSNLKLITRAELAQINHRKSIDSDI